MRNLLFAFVVIVLLGVACAGAPVTGSLTVEEHPIVANEVDTPSHVEYRDRISDTILEVRRAWREPSTDEFLESYNEVLARFGFRVVPQDKPGWSSPVYALYEGNELTQTDLDTLWPVTVNGSGTDLALLVSKLNGPLLLIRHGSTEEWDTSRYGWISPLFVGNELMLLEPGEQGEQLNVRREDDVVHQLTLSGPQVGNPIKGFWSWAGRWVLEVDGQVTMDGPSLNGELGYDEIFGWQLLKGQPFYFFKKDNNIGVSYAGQVLPYHYGEVIHYQCCEPAAFNVAGNESMVRFHALRDGMWYYVEMGVYQ